MSVFSSLNLVIPPQKPGQAGAHVGKISSARPLGMQDLEVHYRVHPCSVSSATEKLNVELMRAVSVQYNIVIERNVLCGIRKRTGWLKSGYATVFCKVWMSWCLEEKTSLPPCPGKLD